MRRAVVLYSVLILMFSCQWGTTDLTINNPKIKSALEAKEQKFIETSLRDCKAEVLARAVTYVDSLISEQIIYYISDSIVFPPRPERPVWPGPITITDTTKVRPIIISKDTILQ
ncbi:MAG: hypothetical protein J5I52_10760 [Saprospiraceae bacterium]|nr:hypothetical protein [Saprospiraceae bacterium]MCZ2336675.1 hypothetical protein [Chitinophagales bacterium]